MDNRVNSTIQNQAKAQLEPYESVEHKDMSEIAETAKNLFWLINDEYVQYYNIRQFKFAQAWAMPFC